MKIRKLVRKALWLAAIPPLAVAEAAFVAGVLIGGGAIILQQSLMTEEDRAEEMARRHAFVEKVKADRYYR